MYLEGMHGPTDGYTLMAGVIRPASRGELRLALGRPRGDLPDRPGVPAVAIDTDALVAAIGSAVRSARRMRWRVAGE